MEQTKIKFWGGLNTIGGNIAEIRCGNDRVIFDFGNDYNPADVILTNAKGRVGSRVSDMLKLGRLAKIDGIYSKKELTLANIDLISAEESEYNTGIFISHLHLDHIGSIDTIAKEIPFYMSTGSKEMLEQLMKIGEPPFKNLAEIRTFSDGEVITVGQIKVTATPVDHDCYGSVSLFIETPDKKVCYSGDLRMHGQQPEINHIWMEKMNAQNLDLLLMEATTYFPVDESDTRPAKEAYSELDIPIALEQKFKETKGLVFFNPYHRNTDRLKHFTETSKKCGRILVLEAPTAQLVTTFFPEADFKVLAQTETTDWINDLYERYGMATIKEINENPSGYVVQNSFEHVLSLIDYDLTGSAYIHSNGMPLGAFDPAFGSLLSFLETLNVQYESIGTSGHADQESVLDIIDTIAPKTLVIWHSLAPERVVPRDPEQKMLRPELNMWYTI